MNKEKKKEYLTLVIIQIFFSICMVIGVWIAKPIIESEQGDFWTIFFSAVTGIVLFSVGFLYLRWYKLKKRKHNVPENDERTFNNIINAMAWSAFLFLLISSISVFALSFSGIQQIEVGWLYVYLLGMWGLLLLQMIIGKLR